MRTDTCPSFQATWLYWLHNDEGRAAMPNRAQCQSQAMFANLTCLRYLETDIISKFARALQDTAQPAHQVAGQSMDYCTARTTCSTPRSSPDPGNLHQFATDMHGQSPASPAISCSTRSIASIQTSLQKALRRCRLAKCLYNFVARKIQDVILNSLDNITKAHCQYIPNLAAKMRYKLTSKIA